MDVLLLQKLCLPVLCGELAELVSILLRNIKSKQNLLDRIAPVQYWSRHESERYDRVLLDAPCSNDRHIVQQVSLPSEVSFSSWICSATLPDQDSFIIWAQQG